MRAPTDLRLVPAASAAWLCAALLVGASVRATSVAAAVAGAVWVVGLVLVRVRRVRRVRGRAARRPDHGGVVLDRSPPVGRPGGTSDRPPTGPSVGSPPGTAGRGRPPVWQAQVVLVAAAALAVLLSGTLQLGAREAGGLTALAEERVSATVTGVVRSAVRPVRAPWGDDERYRVVVSVHEVTARGVTTVTGGALTVVGDAAWQDVPYGATVTAAGRLAPTDPGREAAGVLQAGDPPVLVAQPGAGLRAVNAIRAGLLDVTDGLSAQGRGLVPGVAVGDTSRLEDDLDEAMIVTSLTHITAVSGGHFAIIVATVAGLCVLARLPRAARVAVTGLAMAGFVTLVHPEPSVLRAAAMGAVGLVAIASGRPSRALPALATGVLVLLVVDPWLARSFGFALSTAATAGLVLGTSPLARRLEPWCGRVGAYALAVPLAAQLACAPIVVLLDPSVSTYAVPANLVAAPALGPATVLGVLAALLAPVWPAGATALGWVASLFTWWIATVAEVFAALPAARLPWPGGPGGAVLLGVVTVVGLVAVTRWRDLARRVGLRVPSVPEGPPDEAAVPRRRRRTLLVVLLLLGALAAAAALHRPGAGLGVGGTVPPDWQVATCDVGQGDALVVRTGPGAAVVVDVGPATTDAGRCLDGLGVTRVDLLVLTHFHADHVGGLPAVLRGREVVRALVSPVHEPAGQAARTLGALDEAGVPVEVATPDHRGRAGAEEVGWEVLWPAGRVADLGANDASVVVRLDTGDLTVIALGDLEDAGQNGLYRALRNAEGGGVDVVKVAHHGSRVQSERLARLLDPTVALVSSGENTYGHPTDEALDLYRDGGAVVLRTDRCGTFALVVRDGEIGLAGCRDGP